MSFVDFRFRETNKRFRFLFESTMHTHVDRYVRFGRYVYMRTDLQACRHIMAYRQGAMQVDILMYIYTYIYVWWYVYVYIYIYM